MADKWKSKGKNFTWQEEQQHSFDTIKQALAIVPILAIVDPTKSFLVAIDASEKAIGAVLLQEGRPIAFEVRNLIKLNRIILLMKGNFMPLCMHLRNGVITCMAPNLTLCLTKKVFNGL